MVDASAPYDWVLAIFASLFGLVLLVALVGWAWWLVHGAWRGARRLIRGPREREPAVEPPLDDAAPRSGYIAWGDDGD